MTEENRFPKLNYTNTDGLHETAHLLRMIQVETIATCLLEKQPLNMMGLPSGIHQSRSMSEEQVKDTNERLLGMFPELVVVGSEDAGVTWWAADAATAKNVLLPYFSTLINDHAQTIVNLGAMKESLLQGLANWEGGDKG